MKIDPAFFREVNTFLEAYPASVDSWVRTPERNKAIGGASNSWHVKGMAVDLIFDTVEQLFQGAHAAVAMGFGGVEVDLLNKHLHLDGRSIPWHVVQTTMDNKKVMLQLSEYVATIV